ncbi:hypothetical protein [Glaciimonas sp. PCH181]|uniref:hypothetical protein n=1 Tax=Glaciimonas sp. PCH181 TaxID=2133943 RepID=UPI000D38DAA6|nr:hypothetical protein [Glaciimonas sp. PCH181]PUA18969.1 hypothetical protein C7W93_03395 [Glaciimonas sp. PCH181]
MVTRTPAKPTVAAPKKPVVKAPVQKAKPAAKVAAVAPKKPVAVKKPVVAKKAAPAKASVAPAPKSAASATTSPAAKAIAAPTVIRAKPVPEPKLKAKKAKLVRDSFTMPEDEYQVLSDVKKACLKAGLAVKKSELLRIGVALIKDLDNAKLKAAIANLPLVKAGRPKKDK